MLLVCVFVDVCGVVGGLMYVRCEFACCDVFDCFDRFGILFETWLCLFVVFVGLCLLYV